MEPKETTAVKIDMPEQEYAEFLKLKDALGLSANTELIRYALKKLRDEIFGKEVVQS